MNSGENLFLERRRRIGLSAKPKLDESPEPPPKPESKYKDEQINLEKSDFKNVTFLTLLAADKAFSASMASVLAFEMSAF